MSIRDETQATALVDRLTKLHTDLHDYLESDIGGCLGGIAGGCDACDLCEFDRYVRRLKNHLLGRPNLP